MNNEIVKSCRNCNFRKGVGTFSKCDLSMSYCSVERKWPYSCGKNYENWSKRLSIIEKLNNFLSGK